MRVIINQTGVGLEVLSERLRDEITPSEDERITRFHEGIWSRVAQHLEFKVFEGEDVSEVDILGNIPSEFSEKFMKEISKEKLRIDSHVSSEQCFIEFAEGNFRNAGVLSKEHLKYFGKYKMSRSWELAMVALAEQDITSAINILKNLIKQQEAKEEFDVYLVLVLLHKRRR